MGGPRRAAVCCFRLRTSAEWTGDSSLGWWTPSSTIPRVGSPRWCSHATRNWWRGSLLRGEASRHTAAGMEIDQERRGAASEEHRPPARRVVHLRGHAAALAAPRHRRTAHGRWPRGDAVQQQGAVVAYCSGPKIGIGRTTANSHLRASCGRAAAACWLSSIWHGTGPFMLEEINGEAQDCGITKAALFCTKARRFPAALSGRSTRRRQPLCSRPSCSAVSQRRSKLTQHIDQLEPSRTVLYASRLTSEVDSVAPVEGLA